MFTLIASVVTWIGDQLAVPVRWFLSLPFYDWQLPLIVALLIIAFYGRLLVAFVRTFIRAKAAIADAQFDREWTNLGRMTDPQFAAKIASLKEGAEKKIADAEDLEELAERQRLWVFPGAARKLLNEAERCRQSSDDNLAEIERLQALRAEYKKREAEQGGSIARVLGLIRQLTAANPHAQHALAQLNQLAAGFDWSRLAPADFPPHTRQVMAKTLRMMASTSNINEARNAYGRASQMLQNHRMDWEDLAA
jgi:hypothetical protein